MGLEGWTITRWAAAALVAMVAGMLLAAGWSEESLRAVVRATARSSLAIFVAVFAASSALRLWPGRATRWLLRNRRHLGVSFAVSHYLHLLSLVAVARWFPEPFLSELTAPDLVGGGAAYALVGAMALTSSDRAQAWLGRARWRRLHLVGLWWVWVVFALSYVPRAVQDAYYLPAALALFAALAVRLAPRVLARARRAPAYSG